MSSNLINTSFFFILEICSIIFLTNQKVANWVYNKQLCYDIFSAVTYFKNYPHIKEDYEKVLQENCRLKGIIKDHSILQKNKKVFDVINAMVINRMTTLNKNYFTIDRGSKYGINEEMSVVCNDGFVGIIANVGDFYSTIIPLIHDNFYVSALLNNSKAIGTIKWDGVSLKQTRMLYVPKYIEVQVGEEIFTSGFDSSICPNILIGTVDHVEDDENTSFHNIVVNLKNDFNTLHEVSVISNKLLKEKINLEKKTVEQYG